MDPFLLLFISVVTHCQPTFCLCFVVFKGFVDVMNFYFCNIILFCLKPKHNVIGLILPPW